MKIKLSEIDSLVKILLGHLKASGKTEFEIEDDYYWFIPKESLYNPLEDPKKFTAGQLSDDWQELRKILLKEDEPIGYNLVWLAAILRYIGEKHPG